MIRTLIAIAALSFSVPAFADGHSTGDAEAGAKTFKKCKSCHMIVADDGEVILKGGKSGPNLYGVIGMTAGTSEGFKYSKDLMAAGEAGLVWDEELLATWVQDPKAFLKDYLDNSKAKSKMSFKLKKGGEDVAVYLASVGPVVEEAVKETGESEEVKTDG
jgi:cytochrome c|tara:strand:- start:121 stop:600 length:480 start_codon:yes stop_codon:yes gene_type:complete